MMPDAEPEAGALFRAGRLEEAVEAANAGVRAAPANAAPRLLLAELLLFAGNLDRADRVLDAATSIEPEAALPLAEFRQLLRAELARRQLHAEGRLPEFLGEPTPSQSAMLRAIVALRAGEAAEAAEHAALAESLRPRAPGRAGGAVFEDFRDVDDLCAGFFEVLTSTGKYFWIPTERVETAAFQPPKRPRDLFWRRCAMSVRGGPDGQVYIPALYALEDPARGPEYRLGRATDWVEAASAPVRGIGQRVFLAGEEAMDVMQLTELAFDAEGGT